MRLLLWLLAAASLIFLILGIINLSGNYLLNQRFDVSLDKLSGFENTTTVPGLEELEKLYVNKIAAAKAEAEKKQKDWVLISFAVTALTAGSTLVSSIGAIKKDDLLAQQRALIVVAILTFLASLASWEVNHLNDTKTSAQAKVTALKDHRNKFYIDFMQAANEPDKIKIIEKAKRDLDIM